MESLQAYRPNREFMLSRVPLKPGQGILDFSVVFT
jgi:hypothetical protein